MQECLMIGAGHSLLRRKIAADTSESESNTQWKTLDMNPRAYPDIVFNLKRIESRIPWWNRIPVKDESFHEVHAYEVIEHYGKQGDFKGFFRGMRELWRILKPGGPLIGTCPAWNSIWAWSDPGHCRMVSHGVLSYLTKELYDDLGVSQASDYRKYVDPCWWKLEHSKNPEEAPHAYVFALKKVVK